MSNHERDYLERTIATVRNHRGADNCWPQWANVFADEIERLWLIEDSAGAAASGENPRYGPGNPDWEHDREREDRAC